MIIRLSNETQTEEKLGNKGKYLLQMKKSGFNVPEGIILDSEVYDETITENGLEKSMQDILEGMTVSNVSERSKQLRSLIEGARLSENALRNIEENTEADKLYAVRSSGSKEDLEGYSFAGQYDTFLNVRRSDIAGKVIECYASMFGERVLQYLLGHSVSTDELKMSVVIQEMVDAQYSGICFTLNPSTGNDKEMLIEVSEGLGENLVSGKTMPEQYFYNWYDGMEVNRKESNQFLSADEVQSFSKTFAEIQQFFGYPCDIEFAIAGGKLYILQAREITKIRYGGIKDVWSTADFKDGGVSATVCTPYMWSLYEYIWEFSLRKFIVMSKILKDEELPKKLGEMFYGRPYWNLSAVKKAMSQVIGYKEREFDNEFGIAGDYEGDGEVTKLTPASLVKMAHVVVRQSQILRYRRKNAQRYKEELLERYYSYKKRYDLRQFLSIERDFYQLTKKTYLKSETTYFWQIFINTIHQSLYKDSLLKYVSESDYLTLLGSIDNISHLLPFYEMWDVTREIRKNEESMAYWQETDADTIVADLDKNMYCMPSVKRIISKYGYHSDKELDVTYPCYYEEPVVVVQMVKDMTGLEDSFAPTADKESARGKMEEVLSEIEEEVSGATYRKICKKIGAMRSMLWWREEYRDISTRFYYLIRVYTIEMAKKLEADGVLKKWDDVWFLKVGAIWDFLDGKLSVQELRSMILKNRRYYQAYRNYISENEIGTNVVKMQDANNKDANNKNAVIRGLGANNGIVTGVARVIEDFAQIDRLREGDILVTKFTDTGWTSKFAILSGIVTEYGGILCHAAIVSREYDIPAIVCCKDAMKKIKDGETITLDGERGIVTVIKDA